LCVVPSCCSHGLNLLRTGCRHHLPTRGTPTDLFYWRLQFLTAAVTHPGGLRWVFISRMLASGGPEARGDFVPGLQLGGLWPFSDGASRSDRFCMRQISDCRLFFIQRDFLPPDSLVFVSFFYRLVEQRFFARAFVGVILASCCSCRASQWT